jgi:hypothetical protein
VRSRDTGDKADVRNSGFRLNLTGSQLIRPAVRTQYEGRFYAKRNMTARIWTTSMAAKGGSKRGLRKGAAKGGCERENTRRLLDELRTPSSQKYINPFSRPIFPSPLDEAG